MKIKMLDRPREPGPKQDAWDEATRELRRLQHAEWRAQFRKPRGSRRSRKLFHERVVLRAMRRAEDATARCHAIQQATGEIIEVALGEWRHAALYSTVEF